MYMCVCVFCGGWAERLAAGREVSGMFNQLLERTHK